MHTLDDWELWQRAAGLSDRTITERRTVILKLCQDNGVLPLAIEPLHIMRYIGRPGISTTTKATYHASIWAFTGWCVRAGLRADDPAARTPVPKRPKSLPRPIHGAQLVALLAAANRQRTKMMVLLAALAGLRVHEIAKFRGEDLGSGSITVTGKGGKTAAIPAHVAILDAARYFPAEGYWFPSYKHRGEPVQPAAVGKAIRAAMERAGVHGTAHQLRHWYGTALLEQGEDLRTVQELMRHESVATTQIYTQVTDSRRRAAIDRLGLPAA